MKEINSNFVRDVPKFLVDGEFKNVPAPFPNSTFSMFVVGKPKSGKTSFVIDILCNKKRPVYYKKFDRVYIIQPELSRHSIKKDPFKCLPERQKYEEFNLQTLTELYDIILENSMHEENSLLFLDDVASHLKSGGAALEQLFMKFFFLKRHLRLSIICAVQRFSSLPKSIRAAQDFVVLFVPANRAEREIIYSEFIDLPRKTFAKLMDHCFQEKHDLIFHQLGTKDYYRNMNLLEFGEDDETF